MKKELIIIGLLTFCYPFIGNAEAVPIVNIGGPYTFILGEDWQLDASGSYDNGMDSTGGSLGYTPALFEYKWSFVDTFYYWYGARPDLPAATIETIITDQFGGTRDIVGQHTIELTVTNDLGGRNSARTIVTINPVPEPTTLLLLGTGFIGFIGLGRKKLLRK